MTEFFDVFDENGTSTGEIRSREDCHRLGLWHRTVHIWVLREDGMLLFQKRHPDKDTHPGYWDVSAAGHISAGQSVLEAAQRELEEELGLTLAQEDFQHLFTLRYRSTDPVTGVLDHEFQEVFLVRGQWELHDFRAQPEEVTGLCWEPLDSLRDWRNAPMLLVDHDDEYQKLHTLLSNKSNGHITL